MTEYNDTGMMGHTNAAADGACGGAAFRFYTPQSLWLAFMALHGTLGTEADASMCSAKQSGAMPQTHMAQIYRAILNNMNRLYRQRQLLIDHVRVLRFYGAKGRPPRDWVPREARAATLWAEALAILAPSWREMGYLRDDMAYLWDKAAEELRSENPSLPPACVMDSLSLERGGALWRN